MAASKSSKKKIVRSPRSKTISFFIGIITVAIVALLIFQFAQGNNYKQVLGTESNVEVIK